MRSETVDLPDQTRTVIEWFGDDVTPEKGLVAFLPALGVGVDYYRSMAEAWARRGYRVAGVEIRGQKQSSVQDIRRNNFGYKEILHTDLATLVPRLKEQAQGKPFLLAGHSLGAQFCLIYASLHPGSADGVVVLAGGSNYYGSMGRPAERLKNHFGIRLARTIDQVLGWFPGHKLGFGGRQPLNMMLDWTYEGLTGRYRAVGDPTDYDQALGTLRLPVLMVSLSGDAFVPKSCADFLARKLKQASVTQVELQARDYGLPTFHHFRWTRKPDPVLDQVDQWVRTAIGQAASARASAGA